MKVASYFTLKNVDENLFKLWVKTLPVHINGGLLELLWLRTKGKKSVVWTKREGFIFFK